MEDGSLRMVWVLLSWLSTKKVVFSQTKSTHVPSTLQRDPVVMNVWKEACGAASYRTRALVLSKHQVRKSSRRHTTLNSMICWYFHMHVAYRVTVVFYMFTLKVANSMLSCTIYVQLSQLLLSCPFCVITHYTSVFLWYTSFSVPGPNL